MKNLVYTLIFGLAWICTGCADFLESQTPQGSVDEYAPDAQTSWKARHRREVWMKNNCKTLFI